MLRGHESLIRLVGKRQRNLRLEDVAAASEETTSCASLSSSDSVLVAACEWVECPVCAKRIRGDEISLNSHLDLCLENGRRKSKRASTTQLTLLQFSCSKSILEKDEAGPETQCERLAQPVSASQESRAVLVSDHCRNEVFLPKQKLIEECDYIGCIETKIAGRKYNREAPCEVGMKLRLVREPENPKDIFAIKVLSADGPSLGHIPKILACHLAPLLDENVVAIEGYVTSLPDHSEAPRIKLEFREFNERMVGSPSKEAALALSWEKLMSVADSEKGNGSNYRKNFLYLLETVLQRDSHLFSLDEVEFLEGFRHLSEDAQCLFVRLVQRKGPWFRVQSFGYQDVMDKNSAAQELVDRSFFISGDLKVEIVQLLNLLTVQELKQLTSSANVMKRSAASVAKKNELVAAISDALKSQESLNISSSTLTSSILQLTGMCIRISDNTMFLLWRLQRLFFLDGEQELSLFLLVDIGKIKYPNYKCARSMPVFETREALLAYEQALQLAQVVDMSLEANDHERLMTCLAKSRRELEACEAAPKLKHPFLSRFSSAWVYTTICTLAVSVLERQRRYMDSVDLLKQLLARNYCPGRRGYWTIRLSVDLEHLHRVEESLRVAEGGLDDCNIRAGDRVALQKRVLRLGRPPRRWKVPAYAAMMKKKHKEVNITGRPLNCAAGVKSRFYGYDDQQCSVEELALQYYAGEDGGSWTGVHSEGGVWLTLFGLLFWDIIFSDVPDVFQTPFQNAPLDLYTESFYTARSSLIQARLEVVEEGAAAEIIAATWKSNHGTFCRGVNWEKYSLEDLETISSCIGGSGLSAICKLLAEDQANWTAGMPDLLLWRSLQRDAKLVEVKGPGDRLSEQQIAWFLILSDAGVSVELCKVSKQHS